MKKALCLSVFLIVYLSLAVYGKEITFDYSKKAAKSTTDYPSTLSLKIETINRLDYIYVYKIIYETPKPALPPTPMPSLMPPPAKRQAEIKFVEINKILKNRVVCFGQKSIDKWFKDNEETIKPVIDVINNNNPQDEAGLLILSENDISDSLFKTGPGGAIIVEITAIPRYWIFKDNDIEAFIDVSADENKDNIVEDKELDKFIGQLGFNDNKLNQLIINHSSRRIFRVEFTRPKNTTYSFGPYFSLMDKNIYGAVRNPDYVEGSTDPDKKHKYYIGLTEESPAVYGVAAFWNAHLFSLCKDVDMGLSWGVAYSLQNQIDTAINGLMGVCFRICNAPAMLHTGVSFGFIYELPELYKTEKTPIGENEVIPQIKKFNINWFISMSFGL